MVVPLLVFISLQRYYPWHDLRRRQGMSEPLAPVAATPVAAAATFIHLRSATCSLLLEVPAAAELPAEAVLAAESADTAGASADASTGAGSSTLPRATRVFATGSRGSGGWTRRSEHRRP